MNKNQIINFFSLFLAQLFSYASAPLIIFSGSFIGDRLLENKNWITVPIATLVVGTALFSFPLAKLMERKGRKVGFIGANLIGQFGVGLAMVSLIIGNFWLFCFATALIGMNNSGMQQYRFAVVEGVVPRLKNRLVSLLILSGLIGAIVSLQFATSLRNTYEIEFLGSYVFLAGFLFLSFISLLFYVNQVDSDKDLSADTKVVNEKNQVEEIENILQPDLNLFQNPKFNFSFLNAMFGYVFMSFIMTATPVYMRKYLGYSFEDSSTVIQVHITAMFLPSIFTGVLLDRVGIVKMIRLGIILNFMAVAINNTNDDFTFVLLGLIFLGVGWNFMFISATVYLTRTFTGGVKFKAQGLNEVLVFGGQALASIFSGWFLHNLGWFNLNVFFLPVLMGLFVFSYSKKVEIKN